MKVNIKIILLHLFVWVLYIIVWGLRDMAYAPTFMDTIDGNLIGCLWYSVGVYINFYLLIPYLLLKDRKSFYILSILVLIVLISYLSAQTFSLYYIPIHLTTSEFFDSMEGFASTGSEFLIVLGLSTCLYFINEWYVKERRVKQLESAKLRSELDLLKGQMNPHFLFNALNSVHVLIRRDRDQALKVLEKFSDLLSHQLYDVEKEFVSLEMEIRNLTNFIELQELRFSNHIKVNWKVEGQAVGLKIPPMLFLNFIENAFKHSHTKDENEATIDVLLKVEDSQLEFSCVNSVNLLPTERNVTGIGLINVQRRLEILYPKRHLLQIERTVDQFSINLQIDLHED
ncbi:MAG: histidine kinase [Cytophagia bacterium]|nr:histidine kinase [Cytophagia bacterium]